MKSEASDIKQIEERLYGYIRHDNYKLHEGEKGLDRIRQFMECLGNPQESLMAIHVAGTSGKTSTSYHIARILTANLANDDPGKSSKVGLTISPHLDSITERFQINMEPIDIPEFVKLMNQFLTLVDVSGILLNYFEILIGFTYWYFARIGVEFAVIETGIGGLLDSTNIISRQDKVCVITDIGLDHMAVLGNTLPEIAKQKAGIIQSGNQVFMNRQSEVIMYEVTERCERRRANLHTIDGGVLPSERNWLLALEVADFVIQRSGRSLPSSKVLDDIRKAAVPGRMNLVMINDHQFIMDGAHNAQKIRGLAKEYRALHGNKKTTVIVSLKSGKDYRYVVQELSLIADKIIATSYDHYKVFPVASISPDIIKEACEETGTKCLVIRDINKAIDFVASDMLTGGVESPVIITGSFYLLSEVRRLRGISE